MIRPLRLAMYAALAALSVPARADTIRAHSTTLFTHRQEAFAGELDTVAPLYEILSVTATDVTTPFADEVEVALSTWGAVQLGDLRRWHNGAPGLDRRVEGDVDVGYVKGELLGRRLILRVGRQMVAEGNARMVHLDGGQVRLRLPAGFGVSAYAGSPVAPRFAARGGLFQTGNHQANFASGGRVSWFYPGLLEVGTSVAFAQDRGDPARQDVGADARLTLPFRVELLGSTFFSLIEESFGEAEVAASWRPAAANRWGLVLTADYRHTRPDLFLSRTSILSVFADEQRNDVGGAVGLRPVRWLYVDADYHTLFEPDGTGHRARVKTTLRPRAATDVGFEGIALLGPEAEDGEEGGGYWLARAFAAHRFGRFELTGDLLSYFLTRDVNGEDLALTATGTAGWRFADGWKVLLAGTGGTTPFVERHFDVLAKLVYDQTYITREVP